jgi:hypothetical protein
MPKTILALVAIGAAGLAAVALRGEANSAPTPAVALADVAPAERGAYLVKIMGCNDCHTPWVMTPRGPEPDMTRELSGHPQDFVLASRPELAEPWAWGAAATNTAFAGAWGVSFTANLTPDPETGLGKWTPETFVSAIRNGRHEGQGRPLLPPMPWPMYRNATDADLRAVFAYLQTIPPVRNRVPLPLDPPGAK